MILYFSGTGNSTYTAKKIAELTEDDAVNMNEKIRNGDYSRISSEKSLVFVVPTYAWRIPRVVEEWIGRTEFSGGMKTYFIMTCGEDNGNAGNYAKQLCAEAGLLYMGCAGIVMPENYIAMFCAPSGEEARRIIRQAEKEIRKYARMISSGKKIPDKKINAADIAKSSIVNRVFYRFFVHDRFFYATQDCVSCGYCAKVCPLNNIRLENGTPKWGGNCTQCMACICGCPREAIEYGKKSLGKRRYLCPEGESERI